LVSCVSAEVGSKNIGCICIYSIYICICIYNIIDMEIQWVNNIL
jgi:hypothetical protein